MDMTVEVPELPELTFDEASHIYRLNGDIIPSVSKLMEPLKDQCYGGISKRTLENAAIKGSAVHNSIENWIKFGIDDIPSEHRGYFNGFMEWWKQYKPRVFGSEVRIYHTGSSRLGRVGGSAPRSPAAPAACGSSTPAATATAAAHPARTASAPLCFLTLTSWSLWTTRLRMIAAANATAAAARACPASTVSARRRCWRRSSAERCGPARSSWVRMGRTNERSGV